MPKNGLRNTLIISAILVIITSSGFGIYVYKNINPRDTKEAVDKSKESMIEKDDNSIENKELNGKSKKVPLEEENSKNVVNESENNSVKEKVNKDKNDGKITPEKSSKIVSKYINSENPNIKCRYDHLEKKGGIDYYVVHMYESMQDHVATLGWYYVDVNTGKVFKLDLISDKLIELD